MQIIAVPTLHSFVDDVLFVSVTSSMIIIIILFIDIIISEWIFDKYETNNNMLKSS